MKFKPGDRFYVKENGLKGMIVTTSFNSIHQVSEYIVLWESRSQEESYSIDDCDPLWEMDKQCPMVQAVTMRLPQALDSIPIIINTSGPIKVVCNGHHTWVEVGFHFTKMVCKYCDTEQGKV